MFKFILQRQIILETGTHRLRSKKNVHENSMKKFHEESREISDNLRKFKKKLVKFQKYLYMKEFL